MKQINFLTPKKQKVYLKIMQLKGKSQKDFKSILNMEYVVEYQEKREDEYIKLKHLKIDRKKLYLL